MMTDVRLLELQCRGWRLTRDGSTATASYVWADPEDDESGWEMMVLHTAGHGARFVLEPEGSGLYERSAVEARELRDTLAEALELLDHWQGELPPE